MILLILNEEESNEEEAPAEGEAAEVELRAITGVTSKRTMKLKGQVNGKEVVILIDSGATNKRMCRWVPLGRNLRVSINRMIEK